MAHTLVPNATSTNTFTQCPPHPVQKSKYFTYISLVSTQVFMPVTNLQMLLARHTLKGLTIMSVSIRPQLRPGDGLVC